MLEWNMDMCGTSINLITDYSIHLHNSHAFIVIFWWVHSSSFLPIAVTVSCRGSAQCIWVSRVILNKYSLCLLLRDYKSVKSMPVFLYSPGVNVIELDDFTSEFNRVQSHIHLTGMNVNLDPLPKWLRFV